MDARPSVIDEATSLLDDIDRALVRLAEGTYRSCEVCGTDLDEATLLSQPTRRRCGEHADAAASVPGSVLLLGGPEDLGDPVDLG